MHNMSNNASQVALDIELSNNPAELERIRVEEVERSRVEEFRN